MIQSKTWGITAFAVITAIFGLLIWLFNALFQERLLVILWDVENLRDLLVILAVMVTLGGLAITELGTRRIAILFLRSFLVLCLIWVFQLFVQSVEILEILSVLEFSCYFAFAIFLTPIWIRGAINALRHSSLTHGDSFALRNLSWR